MMENNYRDTTACVAVEVAPPKMGETIRELNDIVTNLADCLVNINQVMFGKCIENKNNYNPTCAAEALDAIKGKAVYCLDIVAYMQERI